MSHQMDETLLKFLEQLDTTMAKQMLADLKDNDRRSPQLYNAINKLLDRHKFQIQKLTPDESILGGLQEGLDAYRKTVDKDGLADDDVPYLN